MAIRIHLLPRKGSWVVKAEGSEEVLESSDNKKSAEEAGRRIARERGAEFIIHNADGQISDSDSYGNDPASSKDSIH